jgi:hypothetical protein
VTLRQRFERIERRAEHAPLVHVWTRADTETWHYLHPDEQGDPITATRDELWAMKEYRPLDVWIIDRWHVP